MSWGGAAAQQQTGVRFTPENQYGTTYSPPEYNRSMGGRSKPTQQQASWGRLPGGSNSQMAGLTAQFSAMSGLGSGSGSASGGWGGSPYTRGGSRKKSRKNRRKARKGNKSRKA